MNRSHQANVQAGLSLLELLVAFAIMAISIGLLYRSMGGSVRSAAEIDRHQQALIVIESVLALRDAVTPDGWNETGTSAGFKWEVHSSPYQQPTLPELASGPEAAGSADHRPLHQVNLRVSWEGGVKPGHIDVITLLPQRKPFPGEVIR